MVGVWEVQEADEGLVIEPERCLRFGEKLVGGEPDPEGYTERFDCPVGIYHQHVPRYGEPNCFLCGKWITNGRAYVIRFWWGHPSPLDDNLEPDEGDYHDWPDLTGPLMLEGDYYVVRPSWKV